MYSQHSPLRNLRKTCLVCSGRAKEHSRGSEIPRSTSPTPLARLPGTDDHQKKQYYEVIAWAAAACQSGVSDPNVEDVLRARASAEAALKVVKLREQFVTGTIILRN